MKSGRAPNHRIIELCDPRPDRMERAVLVARADSEPLWADVPGSSPAGTWIAELGSVGLAPRLDCRWVPSSKLTRRDAEQLASARVDQIIQWANEGTRPDWLLDVAKRTSTAGKESSADIGSVQ
jgi:hypothetical protein